jgi:hypothetical protein
MSSKGLYLPILRAVKEFGVRFSIARPLTKKISGNGYFSFLPFLFS